MSQHQRRIVRASELAEYGFCKRSWWYNNVAGEASENLGRMRQGTQAHSQHGLLIVLGRWARLAGYGVIATAILWLLVSWFLG